MSEWKEYTINDLVSEYLDFRGKTPRKLGMDWGNGNIKALSANNVEKGKINFNKECYLASEELYKIWMNKGDCKKGDVLITMEAPLGNIAQIPDDNKYILSQRTLLFKSRNEIVNNDCFFYILSDRAFQNELQKNSSGSTVTGIQQKKLARIKIKLPSIETQYRIAKILSISDATINQTQKYIAKYKAIKQGLLHDLFTRGLDANGHLRPTYHDAPDLYKDSELGMIPKEWEVTHLNNIFSVSSGTGLTQKNIKPGNCPVYGGNGINGYHNQYLFENKRLIIGRVGEYCGNAFITEPKAWVTDNALIITFLHNDVYMMFWYYYLNYINLNRYSFAAAQPVITGNLLSKVKCLIINEEEQIKIIKRLSSFDNKIKTEETLLQKYLSIKRGLMGDLLGGNGGRKRKQIK